MGKSHWRVINKQRETIEGEYRTLLQPNFKHKGCCVLNHTSRHAYQLYYLTLTLSEHPLKKREGRTQNEGQKGRRHIGGTSGTEKASGRNEFGCVAIALNSHANSEGPK